MGVRSVALTTPDLMGSMLPKCRLECRLKIPGRNRRIKIHGFRSAEITHLNLFRPWRSPSFLIERSEFAESVGARSAIVCCVSARCRDARHARRRPHAATACAAIARSAWLWPAPTRSHAAASIHRQART